MTDVKSVVGDRNPPSTGVSISSRQEMTQTSLNGLAPLSSLAMLVGAERVIISPVPQAPSTAVVGDDRTQRCPTSTLGSGVTNPLSSVPIPGHEKSITVSPPVFGGKNIPVLSHKPFGLVTSNPFSSLDGEDIDTSSSSSTRTWSSIVPRDPVHELYSFFEAMRRSLKLSERWQSMVVAKSVCVDYMYVSPDVPVVSKSYNTFRSKGERKQQVGQAGKVAKRIAEKHCTWNQLADWVGSKLSSGIPVEAKWLRKIVSKMDDSTTGDSRSWIEKLAYGGNVDFEWRIFVAEGGIPAIESLMPKFNDQLLLHVKENRCVFNLRPSSADGAVRYVVEKNPGPPKVTSYTGVDLKATSIIETKESKEEKVSVSDVATRRMLTDAYSITSDVTSIMDEPYTATVIDRASVARKQMFDLNGGFLFCRRTLNAAGNAYRSSAGAGNTTRPMISFGVRFAAEVTLEDTARREELKKSISDLHSSIRPDARDAVTGYSSRNISRWLSVVATGHCSFMVDYFRLLTLMQGVKFLTKDRDFPFSSSVSNATTCGWSGDKLSNVDVMSRSSDPLNNGEDNLIGNVVRYPVDTLQVAGYNRQGRLCIYVDVENVPIVHRANLHIFTRLTTLKPEVEFALYILSKCPYPIMSSTASCLLSSKAQASAPVADGAGGGFFGPVSDMLNIFGCDDIHVVLPSRSMSFAVPATASAAAERSMFLPSYGTCFTGVFPTPASIHGGMAICSTAAQHEHSLIQFIASWVGDVGVQASPGFTADDIVTYMVSHATFTGQWQQLLNAVEWSMVFSRVYRVPSFVPTAAGGPGSVCWNNIDVDFTYCTATGHYVQNYTGSYVRKLEQAMYQLPPHDIHLENMIRLGLCKPNVDDVKIKDVSAVFRQRTWYKLCSAVSDSYAASNSFVRTIVGAPARCWNNASGGWNVDDVSVEKVQAVLRGFCTTGHSPAKYSSVFASKCKEYIGHVMVPDNPFMWISPCTDTGADPLFRRDRVAYIIMQTAVVTAAAAQLISCDSIYTSNCTPVFLSNLHLTILCRTLPIDLSGFLHESKRQPLLRVPHGSIRTGEYDITMPVNLSDASRMRNQTPDNYYPLQVSEEYYNMRALVNNAYYLGAAGSFELSSIGLEHWWCEVIGDAYPDITTTVVCSFSNRYSPRDHLLSRSYMGGCDYWIPRFTESLQPTCISVPIAQAAEMMAIADDRGGFILGGRIMFSHDSYIVPSSVTMSSETGSEVAGLTQKSAADRSPTADL